jgi:hypothetical protein
MPSLLWLSPYFVHLPGMCRALDRCSCVTAIATGRGLASSPDRPEGPIAWGMRIRVGAMPAPLAPDLAAALLGTMPIILQAEFAAAAGAFPQWRPAPELTQRQAK